MSRGSTPSHARRPETWVSLCNLMLKLRGISRSSAILGSDSPRSNNRKINSLVKDQMSNTLFPVIWGYHDQHQRLWLWKENKRAFLISQLRWHASKNFLFLKLSTLDTFRPFHSNSKKLHNSDVLSQGMLEYGDGTQTVRQTTRGKLITFDQTY